MSLVARNSAAAGFAPPRIFRHSAWDAVLILLALLHGVVLLATPGVVVIAIGLWWNSNTISHNFIHNPFFRSRSLNHGFAAYLSVLLGYPHALWRSRHLAHHAGNAPHMQWSAELLVQTVLVALLWLVIGTLNPQFLLTVYLPGWVLGMSLCSLQGYYEHARGTPSYYGRVYNLLFFNDGWHAEHHTRPREHWTRLRRLRPNTAVSRWPPVLRWLDTCSLEGLERLVLRSARLQRFVLGCHERAFASLLSGLPAVRRVGIVGGGLFPRTAIILRKLLPDTKLVVIDQSQANLDTARRLLSADVELVQATFDPGIHNDFDLLVFPLSFEGDRKSLYRRPPAHNVCIHDWIWRRKGGGAVVSALLLKRLNLVQS